MIVAPKPVRAKADRIRLTALCDTNLSRNAWRGSRLDLSRDPGLEIAPPEAPFLAIPHSREDARHGDAPERRVHAEPANDLLGREELLRVLCLRYRHAWMHAIVVGISPRVNMGKALDRLLLWT